jgi:hypothetical protein
MSKGQSNILFQESMAMFMRETLVLSAVGALRS